MRIVVTGATGNVGVAVVDSLAADPAVDEIVGVARRLPDVPHASPKVRHIVADVACDDLSTALAGGDVVVHLAWHFQPTHAPELTWRANAIGSSRVFDAAVRAGAQAVVAASSVGAYSPVAVDDDRPRDETWPTHSSPTSCYGREKAYLERLLDTLSAGHPELRVVRMRPAFIFGRRAASEQRRIFAGPFVPNVLARPGVLPFLPYPRGLRLQAVHIDDVASAYHAAITSRFSGACNIAAPPLLGGEDLARLLRTRLLHVPYRVVRQAIAVAWHLRLAPTEPALLDLAHRLPVLDTGRATRELGWQPRWSADDAVAQMLAGLADGEGAPTRPLAPDSARERFRELQSLVGGRDA